MQLYTTPSIRSVKMCDAYLAPRITTNHEHTIPSSLERCEETGRLDAFLLNWKEGMPNQPHVYWDSDVAKVLEGMAYAIELRPDAAMEARLNELADRIVSAQQPDGYLNTHFTVVEPENRFKWLHWAHELYCCGHLIEAAVAHHEATGRTNFLDAMCRYTDYLITKFGHGEGQMRGYPGHEEIELALCRLAKVTGQKKYLELAKYFIDERGQKPNYFVQEGMNERDLENLQAHLPVREQTDAVGHAVRAGYLYAGMADVAAATDDKELLAACDRLFDSISNRRMYITGGIGSLQHGEQIGKDWQLPNDSAYAESCAAIALVLFAQRMLNITGEAKYAEVVERAIYNGLISGISLDGTHYFYQNMLEVNDFAPYCRERQPWFSCSCCPTNFCRFLPQIGKFVWSESADCLRLNIPAACVYESNGRKVTVSGKYPYDGAITITVECDGEFDLQVRIPAWCRACTVKKNGVEIGKYSKGGFISLGKSWKNGDKIELDLAMPVRLIRANEHVPECAGKAAIMRGPLVYALEECDNGACLTSLILSGDASKYELIAVEGLPEGTIAITGPAVREERTDNDLYSEAEPLRKACTVTAVPYALWLNRKPGDMLVWARIG